MEWGQTMKAGTHNHVKVKRLKRLLGVPLYRAVGILETIWLLCIDCCDEGNLGKFTDDEIADYLEWDGDPHQLVSALASSGWIDSHESHRFVVHDWFSHCPDFIRERVRMRHGRAKKDREQREIRTYDASAANKSEQNRTDGEHSAACSPLVQSSPVQPSPTNSLPVENTAAAEPKPSRKFSKPTVEEVTAYCRERRNAISPSGFVDYYEANGWRVGRNAMKDWKAAIRYWEKNGRGSVPPSYESKPIPKKVEKVDWARAGEPSL